MRHKVILKTGMLTPVNVNGTFLYAHWDKYSNLLISFNGDYNANDVDGYAIYKTINDTEDVSGQYRVSCMPYDNEYSVRNSSLGIIVSVPRGGTTVVYVMENLDKWSLWN